MASSEETVSASPARPSKATTAKVSRAYLAALNARDLDAAVACWQPGGRDVLHGQAELTAPDGIRAYFAELFGAFPDARFDELSCTAEADRCTIRSRLTGTFAGPGTFTGLEPNGARIDLEVVDCFVVADGLIARNDAYVDGMTVGRQLGVLPPADSPTERRMTKAVNLKTRLAGSAVGDPEPVAEGVWVVRGGFPAKTMNVYLVRDGDGVLVFDGGIEAMGRGVAKAAARMGGITRIVLGHAHADHRGIAAGLHARLGVPVWCHPADRADAEGDGGCHYFDFSKLNPVGKRAFPRLLRLWDGGPVPIAGTVEEGDEVAGFRVIHLPGHAPGLIGLWRESDRLALVSDCFYTLDPQTGRHGPPRVPHAAFNLDTEQARASIRKLAAMEPAAAWPGHADPVTGDVRTQLEQAAATT
ncbi:MAG TPA: ester cyclase [Capillimicrobium sp.]|nr:ester cyclase [Capillimicrobium sp.]